VGRLPRFLWSVPADTPVFVGGTDQTLRSALSPARLGTSQHIYFVDLSWPSESPAEARADAILPAYEGMADVLLLDESETARIYMITPNAAQ